MWFSDFWSWQTKISWLYQHYYCYCHLRFHCHCLQIAIFFVNIIFSDIDIAIAALGCKNGSHLMLICSLPVLSISCKYFFNLLFYHHFGGSSVKKKMDLLQSCLFPWVFHNDITHCPVYVCGCTSKINVVQSKIFFHGNIAQQYSHSSYYQLTVAGHQINAFAK